MHQAWLPGVGWHDLVIGSRKEIAQENKGMLKGVCTMPCGTGIKRGPRVRVAKLVELEGPLRGGYYELTG